MNWSQLWWVQVQSYLPLWSQKTKRNDRKGRRPAWLKACQAGFPPFYRVRLKWLDMWDVLHLMLSINIRLLLWRCRFGNMKGKSLKKGRDWILEKKERRRRQGRCVHECIFNSKNLIHYTELKAFITFYYLYFKMHLNRLLSVSAVCLLTCREVRADTKYTGRKRRPHF